MNRQIILDKAKKCFDAEKKAKFVPGKTYIPVAGKFMDGDDIVCLVDACLDGNLAEGRFSDLFKKDLRDYYKGQVRDISLCNSGASANLLAITAITSSEFGSRRAAPGDEIITVAMASPSVINPIVQNKLTPVFMDVGLGTFTPDPVEIEQAITHNTRAIVLEHPFGNLFDLVRIRDIADEYNLFLIEDSRDALGGTFEEYKAGSVGDISTLSFHTATADGCGIILSKSYVLQKVIESFRGFHDYQDTYSHIGYGMETNDLQAALLVSQLKKLPKIVEQRQRNWKFLHKRLQKYHKHFFLPESLDGSKPSYYGFFLTLKEGTSFTRDEIVRFLEDNQIGTRTLAGRNLTKQPMYAGVHHKVSTNLFNTDIICSGAFGIGIRPGITDIMLEYMADKIDEFMKDK